MKPGAVFVDVAVDQADVVRQQKLHTTMIRSSLKMVLFTTV